MKNKAILLGLLSIGFFATSCSSDDNEGETIVPIQGKYNLRQTGSIVGGNEVLFDAVANESGCSLDYLDLRLSNAAVYGDYDGSDCALTETTGTYVRSHNDLTLTIGGVTTTSDIMNLTNKELKIKDKTTGIIQFIVDKKNCFEIISMCFEIEKRKHSRVVSVFFMK